MSRIRKESRGIEINRMSKLSYQIIDLQNNKECIFVDLLPKTTQEENNKKLEESINLLISKRKTHPR